MISKLYGCTLFVAAVERLIPPATKLCGVVAIAFNINFGRNGESEGCAIDTALNIDKMD